MVFNVLATCDLAVEVSFVVPDLIFTLFDVLLGFETDEDVATIGFVIDVFVDVGK